MINGSLKNAYSGHPDDEDDPYRMANDSTASDPNLPQPTAQVEQDTPKVQPPKEEPAPTSSTPEKPQAVAPPRPTFTQLRESGQARPPAPAPALQERRQGFRDLMTRSHGFEGADWGDIDQLAGQGYSRSNIADLVRGKAGGDWENADWADIDRAMGWGAETPPIAPPVIQEYTQQPPPISDYQPPPTSSIPESVQSYTPIIDTPAPPIEEPEMVYAPPGGITEYAPPVGVNTPTSPTSDALLSLLTGKAQGTDQTDMERATNTKLLDRLNSSSPYDSKAVRDEYDFLSGNIDDDYAMQGRSLDDQMARRGLYGSAGKDFHSGRLSDLNVGKRSAKVSLAQDLANKYATTKGQYDANAIDQAQSGNAQADATRRAWLSQLFGYGNDAFNHDLAGAEFQQRQNESEQDFLLRMMREGYGV